MKVKILVNGISGDDVHLCLLFLFRFVCLFLDIMVHLDDNQKTKTNTK